MTKATKAKNNTAEKTFIDAQKTVEATVQKTVKAAQKTAQETVKVAQENVQKTVKVAQETVKKTVKEAQNNVQKTVKAAQKTAQDTVKSAQENVQKAVTEATVNIDKVTEFSKANYEAFVASSEVAVKVAQTVNVDFIEIAKKAVEKNVTDVKTLFSAKTPVEFFELQATMFKNRYDEFVAEATRVNEEASNTANEVAEPLKARYEEVATKYNLPLVG